MRKKGVERKAGIDYTVNPLTRDVEKRVDIITKGLGDDTAIDVTGVSKTVDQTARLVRKKPCVEPFPESGRRDSWFLRRSHNVFFHPSLFDNEPDILPSRDCTMDDLRASLQMIALKTVRVDDIPTSYHPYSQAEEAYQLLMEKKAVRIVFEWR